MTLEELVKERLIFKFENVEVIDFYTDEVLIPKMEYIDLENSLYLDGYKDRQVCGLKIGEHGIKPTLTVLIAGSIQTILEKLIDDFPDMKLTEEKIPPKRICAKDFGFGVENCDYDCKKCWNAPYLRND